jgi:hypothetical protein
MSEPWKTCTFNDQPIRCRHSHFADGTVRIVWEEGKALSYLLMQEGFAVSMLWDSLGGIRERDVMVQANAVISNPANGNRVFVPLC